MRILSVCLSVCQMRALWQNGRKVSPGFYTTRKIINSEKKNGGEKRPFLPEILGQPVCRFWTNNRSSTSAVRPSEKSSIYTNRKSPMRFPTSPTWSSYVAPKSPKWDSKTKNGEFRPKSHFTWRKPATKFLCVKTISDKVVIGIHWPNYPWKNDWRGLHLLAEILGQSDRVGAK